MVFTRHHSTFTMQIVLVLHDGPPVLIHWPLLTRKGWGVKEKKKTIKQFVRQYERYESTFLTGYTFGSDCISTRTNLRIRFFCPGTNA